MKLKEGSISYPIKHDLNFNRSYQWQPENIKGGVLLLHGLTDSPYSLRHIGDMLARQGFYVLSLRMPGHGTIPAELNRMDWQDWQAATELGARHVARAIGATQPFYVVGYSNGGSLALKYSLDAIENEDMRVPDRLCSNFSHLGRVKLLGEEGALILPPGLLQRLRSNPFMAIWKARSSSRLIRTSPIINRCESGRTPGYTYPCWRWGG